MVNDNYQVRYAWFHNGAAVPRVIDVHDANCTRMGGNFVSNCTNESIPIGYSTHTFGEGNLIYFTRI